MKTDARCKSIELIVSDVDGVLTDGAIVVDNQGIETKQFYVRDGVGIRVWQRAGYKFAILTARTSHIVEIRAAEIGVEVVRQGVEDKRAALVEMLAQLKLEPHQVAFVGDDLPDLAAAATVGFAVAPADACAEMREAAHFVTSSGGGRGVIRETVEHILKSQDRWTDLLRKFTD